MPAAFSFSKPDKILKSIKGRTIYIDDHWIFQGGSKTVDGIRKIVINKRRYNVARVSAFIFLGLDINDDNIQANHRIECNYKTCWNPDHLYVGTHSQNMTDQSTKKEHYWLKQTKCSKGHELDGTYQTMRRGKVKIYRYCITCSKERHRV